MLKITRYNPTQQKLWDDFVRSSKNGTLLFMRNYMDYHAERFADYSLIVLNEKCNPVALMPANKLGDTLFSHQGLTYGGLILGQKMTTAMMLELIPLLGEWLSREGFRRVVYKAVPHVYHRYPSEEDVFALVNVGKAQLSKRMLSAVIDLSNPFPMRQNRRTALNKARMEGVEVSFSDDWKAFWEILEANLMQTYGSKPVHSLAEMQRLVAAFPDEIKLAMASREGRPLAGAVLYLMPEVVHTQYISATPEGKAIGAVDAIIAEIIAKSQRRYLDIGTSAGQETLINESLTFQKEGFGARGVCYDTYEWSLE